MKPKQRLRRPRHLRRLTAEILKGYARAFLRFRVQYHGDVPQCAKLFVANHPTTIDPFILYALFPNAKMLINKDVFHLPFLSWLMRSLGHIATDKRQGTQAYESAKRELQDGYSLIIFPEGGISSCIDNVDILKTGAVRLSAETGTPIVPIGIQVSEPGAIRFHVRTKRKTRLRTVWYICGEYSVSVGKCLPKGHDIDDKSGIRYTTERLRETIDQLRTEG